MSSAILRVNFGQVPEVAARSYVLEEDEWEEVDPAEEEEEELEQHLKYEVSLPQKHKGYPDTPMWQEAWQRTVPSPVDLSLFGVPSAHKDLTPVESSSMTIAPYLQQKINNILEKAPKLPGLLRDVPNLPPLSTGSGPPRRFDYGAAIKRARIGVMIELSTIPLYLYVMYSVKPQKEGIRVRTLLRNILHQEMLHLALIGNLLSALGGSVTLYDPRTVPLYPSTLLCSQIPMHLEALTMGSLGRFMEIEAPVDANHLTTSRSKDRGILASQYDSIGQLYEDLVLCVRGLGDNQFTRNLSKQFVGQDFFGDQLFAITDRSTALKALATIIEQGEGVLSVEDSHYEVFSVLYSGPAWDLYKVPNNPMTEDYKSDPYVYRLSLSFDAAYCYLLQTIQRVWQTDDISDREVLLRNIHGIMSNVLSPLAELLVQQKLKDGYAAPCFNYYPMCGSIAREPLGPRDLHEVLVYEVEAAAGAAPSVDKSIKGASRAARQAADGAQKASKKAEAAARRSSDAIEAKEIADAVQEDLQQLEASKVADTVFELATKIGQNAVQVALHTQATARIGTQISIQAAREAADAAFEANNAGNVACEAARRGAEQTLLERLKFYIEDNLYPPF